MVDVGGPRDSDTLAQNPSPEPRAGIRQPAPAVQVLMSVNIGLPITSGAREGDAIIRFSDIFTRKLLLGTPTTCHNKLRLSGFEREARADYVALPVFCGCLTLSVSERLERLL